MNMYGAHHACCRAIGPLLMITSDISAQATAFLAEHTATFHAAVADATAAAGAGRLREVSLAAERLRDGGQYLFMAVLEDALAAGMDWWALGDMVSLHPQAAWEQYGKNRTAPAAAPARQRPHLAIKLTAGLSGVHEHSAEYGPDIADLGTPCSFAFDPTVDRIRRAAQTLGEDVWIAVNLPDRARPAAEPIDGVDAVKQWISVLTDDDDVAWLREVLDVYAVQYDSDEDLPVG
ncbi:hypothetical protein ACFQO7_31075 [Catellatospora aurea]|uniref:Uncharacterized protein n=1 Tax=Catellatospora aurea TaxID=1337874 RepID=A0ABW2H9E5_9ACTN